MDIGNCTESKRVVNQCVENQRDSKCKVLCDIGNLDYAGLSRLILRDIDSYGISICLQQASELIPNVTSSPATAYVKLMASCHWLAFCYLPQLF